MEILVETEQTETQEIGVMEKPSRAGRINGLRPRIIGLREKEKKRNQGTMTMERQVWDLVLGICYLPETDSWFPVICILPDSVTASARCPRTFL